MIKESNRGGEPDEKQVKENMHTTLFLLTSSIPHRGAIGGYIRGSVHLRELGTGRWVDCASDWARGITRPLVEVDSGIPSAEFVPFGHMSGECENR